jgi:hypothetical protein
VSTSVHLYGDVLLSRVFSILFAKKKTFPRNGRMMRATREATTPLALEACCSECKSGLSHSDPSRGLKVKIRKTMFAFRLMPRQQNAGQDHYTNIASRSLDHAENFEYLRKQQQIKICFIREQ